jgi:hypothetical protein
LRLERVELGHCAWLFVMQIEMELEVRLEARGGERAKCSSLCVTLSRLESRGLTNMKSQRQPSVFGTFCQTTRGLRRRVSLRDMLCIEDEYCVLTHMWSNEHRMCPDFCGEWSAAARFPAVGSCRTRRYVTFPHPRHKYEIPRLPRSPPCRVSSVSHGIAAI